MHVVTMYLMAEWASLCLMSLCITGVQSNFAVCRNGTRFTVPAMQAKEKTARPQCLAVARFAGNGSGGRPAHICAPIWLRHPPCCRRHDKVRRRIQGALRGKQGELS